MLVKACGTYQTNCYFYKGIIIDPGFNADLWIEEILTSPPKAIILTHGHFDHIWSVPELQKKYRIPVYAHKNDDFILKNDIFNIGAPRVEADVLIDKDETIKIGGVEVTFRHFPGHTPGSITIEIDKFMFSGDFIFRGSIGRTDFPFSSPQDMKKSFNKFLKLNYNKVVLPGHGPKTTIKKAQENIREFWYDKF